MASQKVKETLQRDIDDLPDSFTSEEIMTMYHALDADATSLRNNDACQTIGQLQSVLYKRHKPFAMSYPFVFTKACRGEMNERIFQTVLHVKKEIDEGKLSTRAGMEKIVDAAKEHVDSIPKDVRKAQLEEKRIKNADLKSQTISLPSI
jgi:hypothetical protein